MSDRITIRCLGGAGLGLMLVMVSSCSAERRSVSNPDRQPQVVMGAPAQVQQSQPEDFRRQYEVRISRALNNSLGAQWSAHVAIVGEPEATSDDWRWPQAAVTVTLLGQEPSDDPNVSSQTVENFVRKVMRERMDRRAPLAVAVTASRLHRDAESPDSEVSGYDPSPELPRDVQGHEPGSAAARNALPVILVTPPGESPPGSTDAPSQAVYRGPVTRYTVQEGDTWADISIAFYGTPNYWRTVLSANPDIGPAELQAGRVIRVPLEP